MMLCVDKKMLHESGLDQHFGPLRTAALEGSNGGPEHPRHAQAGPAAAADHPDQLRRDVLARVVRISGTLNQRLAL